MVVCKDYHADQNMYRKLAFCSGNQCDANFCVGLQKYIIISPLFCTLVMIFLVVVVL